MKPILFNTEMVRALLNGLKTVTRRVVKPQPKKQLVPETDGSYWHGYFAEAGTPRVVAPPYRQGDILYVLETFFEYKGHYYYKADKKHETLDALIGGSFFKWKPSRHMSKVAARLFLRVTDVRVERLRDIDADGIRAEGITSFAAHVGDAEISRQEFANFWDSTIKKADLPRYGWAANPWVWVIEFERISKEEAYGTTD